MRWLANYVRQMFCQHVWHIEEHYATEEGEFGGYRNGMKVYMRCDKCGWHRRHWKFH